MKRKAKLLSCSIVPPAAPPHQRTNAVDAICAHEELFDNMCALCGAVVTRRKTYRVSDPAVTINGSNLYIPQSTASASGNVTKPAQSLILDIDNTILVSRVHAVPAPSFAEHWPALNLDVVWRPRIVAQLQVAHAAGITLYIHTKGSRAYADQVRARLNEKAASEIVAAANVISRDEERTASKSLRHFFASDDPHVVILDDRTDVWGTDALYVLQVRAFHWPAEEYSEDEWCLTDEFSTLQQIFTEGAANTGRFVNILRRNIHHLQDEPLPADEDIADLTAALSK